MRGTVLRSVIVLAIAILPGASLFSSGPEILDNYYPDATFTSACGWDTRDCDGTFNQDGTITGYRYHELFNCGTGNETSATCQEYDAGTGTWVTVSCPDEGATIQGRIRITVP